MNYKKILPLLLMRYYHFPLIKVRNFTKYRVYYKGENPYDVLKFIQEKNFELYQIILADLNNKGKLGMIYYPLP